MAKKFKITPKQYSDINRQISEIQKQLYSNAKSFLNPELVKLALQDIIEDYFRAREIRKHPILRPSAVKEVMTINALNGKKVIAEDKRIFKDYIDSSFEFSKPNQPEKSTSKIIVQRYTLVRNALFSEMFTSLSYNLDRICLTQSQIINFCKNYPHCLRQGDESNFFLFKTGKKYFVADVLVRRSGLAAYRYDFNHDSGWSGEKQMYVFVPKVDFLNI